MATLNNIGLITVLLADVRKPILELANDGLRQTTAGIPELAGIPIDDVSMHGSANALTAEFNKLHSKPPTTTKANLEMVKNDFITDYNKNALYIQTAARDAAIAAGDVNAGIAIVEQSGYYLKDPKSATTKSFRASPEGSGIVKITTKAVAQRAIYIRQYGTTTAENVPPTQCKELLICGETQIIISGLESRIIYGIREAYVLPISRQADDSEPETLLEEKATLKTISTAHTRVFNNNDESHYAWGPWIYFVAK